jgi:hypothetical protein
MMIKQPIDSAFRRPIPSLTNGAIGSVYIIFMPKPKSKPMSVSMPCGVFIHLFDGEGPSR